WSARDSSRPLTANAMAATTTMAAERLPPAKYRAAAPHRIDSAISAQRSAVPRENGSPARALQMAMPNAGRPLTAITRGTSASTPASVQRAGVDDGLGAAVSAEHDQQVADHLRLALLVRFDHAVLLQLGQRHLDHAHGAGDDPGARGDHRVGLLALQHGLRDFRGIGEVADPGLDHLDAG